MLYISNTWDFIYCRDERSMRWNLDMFRWRGHSLRKKQNNRHRVIAIAHLFKVTAKGKIQSFVYVMIMGNCFIHATAYKNCSKCCYFKRKPSSAQESVYIMYVSECFCMSWSAWVVTLSKWHHKAWPKSSLQHYLVLPGNCVREQLLPVFYVPYNDLSLPGLGTQGQPQWETGGE